MKTLLHFRRIWLFAFAPAALLLIFTAQNHPDFAEWYANTIYSVLSRGGNRVTSLIPFSLMEVLIVLLSAGAVFYMIFFIAKIIHNPGKRKRIFSLFVLNLLCTASVLYFLFAVSCGINYYRYPFAQTCGLDIRPSSKAELTALCTSLAARANELREGVKTDQDSVMRLSTENTLLTAKKAQAAFDSISVDYPLLRAGYGQPKPVHFSRVMSYLDITGIFFPFTFEANVNVDIPDYSIPSTMCHELSHLRGYMREDEANFIGYLVCEKSGDADFRYSGVMLAYIYASNALYSTDPDLAGQISGTLSDGVRRDLANNSAYWKQFEGPVATAADHVNDSYLKANKQQDGVKSYGRMVDLLLAEYRTKKGAE
ncbi:DUF3810 domain-containing protein [Caproiciproducens faecalis]|uniref:DUF3810 domain-containing protein n=1 Tax=Caproiciproducens faecalis TaxID=2820301 RepID=A0ABS7DT79_9FIRM|nr:DUF3810 domain-containing protein [Caproiciproducens faecalis]MBW7573781.1 DUF3810 domain-containing protein [Caproiciproducens faecalis]